MGGGEKGREEERGRGEERGGEGEGRRGGRGDIPRETSEAGIAIQHGLPLFGGVYVSAIMCVSVVSKVARGDVIKVNNVGFSFSVCRLFDDEGKESWNSDFTYPARTSSLPMSKCLKTFPPSFLLY